jgi:hypothetical protein
MSECSKAEIARKARIGVDPVSYCGHHCTYCFLGEECGGCRSTYNACSFATLFKDGKCPNATCCVEKGLDGCYDCADLDECLTAITPAKMSMSQKRRLYSSASTAKSGTR